MATHKLCNTIEVTVKFEIDVPFICSDENVIESASTSTKLILAKLGDALAELKKQYDLTVTAKEE